MQKGSILAFPDEMNTTDAGASYIVEGIGYDFVPDVLTRELVDAWVKTGDEESFEAVRKLMRLEGLLVGGSSGSVLSGALEWLKSAEGRAIAQTKGANVVVLLPDGYAALLSVWRYNLNALQDQELYEQTMVPQDGARERADTARADDRGHPERVPQRSAHRHGEARERAR